MELHRDVFIECSISYVMKTFGNIETFQCPACALHCATNADLCVHQLACQPPTKHLDRDFLAMIPIYEQMAQGPQPLKTWHLKSTSLQRPGETESMKGCSQILSEPI